MERRSKLWWVATDDGRVVQSTGYDCTKTWPGMSEPSNVGYWWFPELGFSAEENVSIFDNRRPAYDRARSILLDQQVRINQRLIELGKE